MKKLFITLLSFVYIFILGTPISTINVLANENEPQISIKQSVDDDLYNFNFDYTKYQVNPDLVYRPIIINFNESISKDYMDLLYVYDPNNNFDLLTIDYDIEYCNSQFLVGDSEVFKENVKNNLFLSGISSDGTIKRYALYGYTEERDNYKYRKYTIKNLNDYQVNNIYLFENTLGVTYSNCMNIRLENPHNWSWHFDEDSSGWEAFKDFYTGSDVLKDQLFYSFYIPDKWKVNNIKSIDLKYKKALLNGWRYNIADTGTTHDFYKNIDDQIYRPKFYDWANALLGVCVDPIGYSVAEIGNKIDFTYKTITPSLVSSSGLTHEYTWNTIQNLEAFKKAFGEDSDIYEFASQYMTNNNENYWIINFDDYKYSYKDEVIKCIEFGTMGGVKNDYEENDLFIDYLKNHGIEKKAAGYSYNYYMAVNFEEEYVFDISATSITYEDGLGVTRTLPISVAPVMEKEGSGGDSETIGEYFEFIINEKVNDFTKIIKVIIFILSLIIIFIIIKNIVKFIKNIRSKNKK